MKKLLLAAAVATLGFVAAPSAMAQTPPHGIGDVASNCTASPCTDADMTVHVAIQGNCQHIEVGDLEFGTHPMLAAGGTANIDNDTQVDVLCNNAQAYTVELDYGINATSTTQRQVKDASGTNQINYALFKDAGRTQPWGTEANQPGSSVAGTGTGAYQTIPIYGRLTQTSADPAGDYTDLVTATLNYN